MTITEFLAARLDEYEAALDDATSGPPNSPAATLGGTAVNAVLTGDWGTVDREVAWLRRDLASKRWMLDITRPDLEAASGEVAAPELGAELGRWTKAYAIARAMAVPYVDHSDYREQWRP